MRRAASVWPYLAFILAGCATIRPRAGLEDVEHLVGARTSSHVAWEGAVGERVRELLGVELTAESAVEIALLNNPALLATYERLGIAQADLVQAGLLPNPVLHASVRFATSGPGPGAELSLLQDVIGMLIIPLRKHVAAAEFEGVKLDVAKAVIETSTDVRAAFYTLQGAEQMVELRRSVVEATDASAEIAGRQHEAGNISDLDLSDEQVLSAEAKLDLARAEAEALAGREELNALLGLWGHDTEWRIGGRLPRLPSEEMRPEGLESLAVRQRLDLAAARQAVEVEAQSLGLRRATALFLDGALGGEAEKEPGGAWSAGPAVELSVPIFDQGLAAVGRSRAVIREAEQNYAGLAIQIRAAVRRARTRMRSARDRALYYESVVLPLRHRVVQETQRYYNAMQVGVFQLLQAKRDEIDAGRDYVETLTEYWLARTELEHAVGGDLPRPAGSPAPAPTPSMPDAPEEHRHHEHHHHHGG